MTENKTDATKEISRQMRELLEEYAYETGALVVNIDISWHEGIPGFGMLDELTFKTTVR